MVVRQDYSYRTLKKRILRNKAMYLFLLPALILVTIFSYVPMAGIIMSFQDYNLLKGIQGSPFVGLKHFAAFFGDEKLYSAILNTVLLNSLYLLFSFPLPIFLAIMIFSMRDGFFKRSMQTISYIPHFISWVVLSGIAYKVLDSNNGLVNSIIKFFGGKSIPFFREPDYFWPILIISAIWKDLGWSTIIYLAALTSISPEQYDAAKIDGANAFDRLIYITLPGLYTIIGLQLIFATGSLISGGVSFDAILNMRNPLLANPSNTIDYYIYSEGILKSNISYSTAMGISESVLTFTMVYLTNYISRKLRGYGAF